MDKELAKSKLDSAFTRLQKLNLPTSVENMEKLLISLYEIREVYGMIDEKPKEDEDERASADTE